MRHTSKIIYAGLALLTMVSSAVADDFNYLGRGDGVTLSSGDANHANRAIQTPTPWPGYVNDVFIEGNGPRSVATITEYYTKGKSEAAAPTTVINVNGGPAQ